MTNESVAEMDARHKARLAQIDTVDEVKELASNLKFAAIRFGVTQFESHRIEMRDCEEYLSDKLWEITAPDSAPREEDTTPAPTPSHIKFRHGERVFISATFAGYGYLEGREGLVSFAHVDGETEGLQTAFPIQSVVPAEEYMPFSVRQLPPNEQKINRALVTLVGFNQDLDVTEYTHTHGEYEVIVRHKRHTATDVPTPATEGEAEPVGWKAYVELESLYIEDAKGRHLYWEGDEGKQHFEFCHDEMRQLASLINRKPTAPVSPVAPVVAGSGVVERLRNTAREVRGLAIDFAMADSGSGSERDYENKLNAAQADFEAALSQMVPLPEPSEWAKRYVRRVDNGKLGWTPKLRLELASALLQDVLSPEAEGGRTK